MACDRNDVIRDNGVVVKAHFRRFWRIVRYLVPQQRDTSRICSFRNGVCFYRWSRRIAGMRTEAPSPDVRIADRPYGLHRRFGYRRFLVSPVRPIAGFVLEALSPEFPSPEPHIAGRSIAGRFLMCYRRVSKSGDEIRRYQATSLLLAAAFAVSSLQGGCPGKGPAFRFLSKYCS